MGGLGSQKDVGVRLAVAVLGNKVSVNGLHWMFQRNAKRWVRINKCGYVCEKLGCARIARHSRPCGSREERAVDLGTSKVKPRGNHPNKRIHSCPSCNILLSFPAFISSVL